jgi:DNA (cytosine-5)-methyltransferase 1
MPAWVAETDEDASLVLKREHPAAVNHGDITTLLSRTTVTVDELTSGDPCQSMSLAGQRKARADVRFLWPHVAEIIREMRPREVFLENVQGLVSLEGGALLRMRFDDLHAAGYDVRWTVLGACAVGAPHHRHRWFARAVHVGAIAAEAERVVSKCGAPRGGGRALLPTPVCRDGDGRGEGDAVYWAKRAQYRANGLPLGAVVNLLPTPRATDVGTPGRRSSDGWRPQLGQAVMQDWGRFASAVAMWEQITGVAAPLPTEPAPRDGVRLNAALSEWMMGMRAGLVTDGFARNSALRMAGNGVVTLQARTAHELLAPR